MTDSLVLPLPVSQLAPAIQKFADTSAPLPMRTMAAKGIVPVRGADLMTLLTQLAHDADSTIAAYARESLGKIPENILIATLGLQLHPAVLHFVAQLFPSNTDVVEAIVIQPAAHDETLVMIAHTASEKITERIAANEARLLRTPRIIEALYKNKLARMSTIDRLIDLAVRNGLELRGIATYEAHAQAISGQLIVEGSDEPLPEDEQFSKSVELDDEQAKEEAALKAKSAEPIAPIDMDPVDGTETVKPKFKPLAMQIAAMNLAGKIRLAMVGSGAARAILIRDNNRLVAMAAVSSPMMTENEAVPIAKSKEVSVDVLRFIGNRRDWAHNYELKRALVFNPKTPQGLALQYLSHLRLSDLRTLAKSRSIPTSIKNSARQQVEKREKKGGD